MATKTISITTEAYERLRVRKKEKESFSDIINQLTGKRSLLELAGILTDKEGKELMEAIQEGRTRSRKRINKITRMMQE